MVKEVLNLHWNIKQFTDDEFYSFKKDVCYFTQAIVMKMISCCKERDSNSLIVKDFFVAIKYFNLNPYAKLDYRGHLPQYLIIRPLLPSEEAKRKILKTIEKINKTKEIKSTFSEESIDDIEFYNFHDSVIYLRKMKFKSLLTSIIQDIGDQVKNIPKEIEELIFSIVEYYATSMLATDECINFERKKALEYEDFKYPICEEFYV